MFRPAAPIAAVCAALALGVSACGEEIELREGASASVREGAELFRERCSGCHTFEAAGSRGSKAEGQVSGGERTNGPSFDTRHVEYDDALFAIRNGGFSGAIMPANIVVGDEAEKVAAFLDRYSGGESDREAASEEAQQGGAGGGDPPAGGGGPGE